MGSGLTSFEAELAGAEGLAPVLSIRDMSVHLWTIYLWGLMQPLVLLAKLLVLLEQLLYHDRIIIHLVHLHVFDWSHDNSRH